jgi:hypothetical protein
MAKKQEKKNNSSAFDPDKLSLTKKDIIDFCDRVISEWQKKPLTQTNAKNIAAMVGVRTAVHFTDEESLKAIWSEIVKWIYQLLYENAIAKAKSEHSEWASTFEKLKSK